MTTKMWQENGTDGKVFIGLRISPDARDAIEMMVWKRAQHDMMDDDLWELADTLGIPKADLERVHPGYYKKRAAELERDLAAVQRTHEGCAAYANELIEKHRAATRWKAAAETQNALWAAAATDLTEARAEIEQAQTRLATLRHGIGQLLAQNGCDCECDHTSEEHEPTCARCFACRVAAVLDGVR